MLLKNTLTTQEKISLLNNQSVGIFNSLITGNEPYAALKTPLCQAYYTAHSGNKTISPVFEDTIKFIEEEELPITAAEYLGRLIKAKYEDKWTRVYNAFMLEYDVQNDTVSSRTIHDKSSGTDKTVGTSKMSTNDTNARSYDNYGEHTDTSFNRNTTVSEDASATANSWAFNSETAKPISQNSNDATVTTEQKANKNFDKMDRVLSGSIIDNMSQRGDSNTDAETTYGKENDRTDELDLRRRPGAELIEAEISFRNKEVFFDIVFKDIDEIATLNIYE